MTNLILLTLLCTIISTGYLQEISTKFNSPSLGGETGNVQVWSLQGEKKSKPCTRKSEKNNEEEQWIPSYSSRITHHLPSESFLQPQALKNENYLTELNTDPSDDSNVPGIPERRSLNAPLVQPQEDTDCDEEPMSPPLQSAASSAAIKLLKLCVKHKKLFGSSRRSMPEPEVSDSDESLLSDEDESQDTEIGSRKAGLRMGKNTEIRSKDTLLNPRVCYACSTATNPSCWEPDRKTTVKYCSKEKSCVTKSFGTRNALTVIRDCADSCESSSVPGIEPKFDKCKVCHTDLCNAAFSINTYNVAVILVISLVKYTFY